MLDKSKKKQIQWKNLFHGKIPDDIVWVYIGHLEKHHLQYLIYDNYMYHLDDGKYMYYFNESNNMGFVVKVNKERTKINE